MKKQTHRLAVIGGGIVGLAHAWAASKSGSQVTVFDRSDNARGASVRNFGMSWLIGRPEELYPVAIRSSELWREFATAMKTTARPGGSVHVVDREDEAAVLEQFATLGADLCYECELWNRSTVEARCPGIAKAGLYNPTETNIDPRESLAALPVYLTEKFGVRFR